MAKKLKNINNNPTSKFKHHKQKYTKSELIDYVMEQ